MSRLGEATGLAFLNFQVALWAPTLIGAVMIFHDWRKGRVRLPWVLATVVSAGIVAGFYLMPRCAWFSAFADWYLGLV